MPLESNSIILRHDSLVNIQIYWQLSAVHRHQFELQPWTYIVLMHMLGTGFHISSVNQPEIPCNAPYIAHDNAHPDHNTRMASSGNYTALPQLLT